MKHELETVLFFPSPSCELCYKAPYTFSSLSNIWTDSRIFGSFSVIRRVSVQFLRYKPVYFLDSLLLTQFQAPLLPSPRGSPASGQVWTWRGRGPGLLLSPPHPPDGEGDLLSAQGTSSLPRLPGSSRPVLWSRESEICEVTGLEISGQLPARGGRSCASIRVSTLAESGSLSHWRSSWIWRFLPRRCAWFTWGDALLRLRL